MNQQQRQPLAARGGSDKAPWFQVDLGAPRDINGTEAYFVHLPDNVHAIPVRLRCCQQVWGTSRPRLASMFCSRLGPSMSKSSQVNW